MQIDLRKSLTRSRAGIGGARVGACVVEGIANVPGAVLPSSQSMRVGVITAH
jgi:hypothetical protein